MNKGRLNDVVYSW